MLGVALNMNVFRRLNGLIRTQVDLSSTRGRLNSGKACHSYRPKDLRLWRTRTHNPNL
jgi:hypothetical protein